jgi:hypothetical protein
MDISLFATTQLDLIRQEHAAEVSEQTSLITSLPPTALQRHGLALLNLSLSTQRTGLGGRTVLELEPDPALTTDGKFPAHGLRSGDIVRIEEQPGGAAKKKEKAELKERGVEGVVHRVSEGRLVVAVSGGKKGGEDDDAGVEALVSSGKRLWAVKMANEVTFRRMVKVLESLKEMGDKQTATGLTRVLFGLDSPAPVEDVGEVKWLDEGLNESQKRAVKFALGSQDIGGCNSSLGSMTIANSYYSVDTWPTRNRKDTDTLRDHTTVYIPVASKTSAGVRPFQHFGRQHRPTVASRFASRAPRPSCTFATACSRKVARRPLADQRSRRNREGCSTRARLFDGQTGGRRQEPHTW